MDISAEVAAIQAASVGNELRQPLVGALNKLNSGTLPTVTAQDAGKILKVGANGWEIGEKSGYMPVPSATKQITDNGTYNVTDYSSAVVNVSGGGSSPVLITKNINQNGTYNASSDSADGYSSVIVNVQSGGSDSYPLWTEIYDDGLPTGISVSATIISPLKKPHWVDSASQNFQDFVDNNCIFSSATKNKTNATVEITKAIAQLNLTQVLNSDLFSELIEYYGYLYGSSLINTYNMVLLGDFSQGGADYNNILADSIMNYSAVVLQGIYSKNRTSVYNTTIIYQPVLNNALWTGMKDRNNVYGCNVTFTDNTHCSLSGNKQVIIYGIP